MRTMIESIGERGASMRGARAMAALLTIAVLPVAAAGCRGEPPPAEEVVRPVRMLEIGFGGATGYREYPGVVAAELTADLAFEVPGLVIEIPVVEGEEVAKGQILARLDARDYEAQRDADRARLLASRADYERYQELYALEAVSLRDLELKQREYEVAEAHLVTSQKAVDDATLRAPFAGRVARTMIDAFQNVQAKEPVLTLQDDSRLEVEINIPESDALVARRGLTLEQRNAMIEAAVEISAVRGEQFPARIAEVATVADPVTRTFKVTFAFDAPEDLAVSPGMTARVLGRRAASSGAPEAFMIPATAVFGADDGSASVWKVDPQRMTVTRVSVQPGFMAGDQIQILGGLSDGDVIATTGAAVLREGMRVKRMEG